MKKKVINIVSGIILGILVLGTVFALYQRINGKPPKIFGYQIFRISSESMEPELMVGDVILNKEIDIKDIKVNDVVTYQGEEGSLKGKIITHKVVQEPYILNDEVHIKTQGILEGSVTDPPVSGSQIYGVLVTKIPLINYFFNFFIHPIGFIVIIILLVLMFYKEFAILLGIVKGNKKEKETGITIDGKPLTVDQLNELERIVKSNKEKEKLLEKAVKIQESKDVSSNNSNTNKNKKINKNDDKDHTDKTKEKLNKSKDKDHTNKNKDLTLNEDKDNINEVKNIPANNNKNNNKAKSKTNLADNKKEKNVKNNDYNISTNKNNTKNHAVNKKNVISTAKKNEINENKDIQNLKKAEKDNNIRKKEITEVLKNKNTNNTKQNSSKPNNINNNNGTRKKNSKKKKK